MLDYKKIKQYAKKFSRKPEDADDIFQEACLLFLEYPSDKLLTNKFYFMLVKRAYWHIKYKWTGASGAVIKNRDLLIADFEEKANLIPGNLDLDNVVLLSEFRNVKTTSLGLKQKNLFKRILNGENMTFEDRGHYEILKIN